MDRTFCIRVESLSRIYPNVYRNTTRDRYRRSSSSNRIVYKEPGTAHLFHSH